MKSHRVILLTAAITIGCTDTQNEVVITSANPDFVSAIETIATSTDLAAVNASLRTLHGGGRPAIDALREHLSDERVIPAVHTTRRAVGTATMGQQAFWSIQDMVEKTRVPLVNKTYYVLTRSDVEDWLDRHQGKSLVGLQIEAASASLGLAKRDYEMNKIPDARNAIEEYSELLVELHHKASEEYSKSLAKLRSTN